MTGLQEFQFAIFAETHLDEAAAAAWFKNALVAMPLETVGLAPMDYARQWWDSGDPLIVGGGAMLRHPRFSSEANDESWAMSLDYLGDEWASAVLGAIPTVPFDAEGRSLAWQWLTDFLERLVRTSRASLCMVNVSDGGGADEWPSAAELTGLVPSAVSAWNYFGASRLTDDIRHRLELLPAFTSRALDGGWLLRPVDYFTDELPASFLAGYEAVAEAPTRFLRGELEVPRGTKRLSRPTKRKS